MWTSWGLNHPIWMTIFRLLRGSNHPFWRFQRSPLWAPETLFVGYIFRDEKLSSYIRDYFLNREIRIPSSNNQDDSWKVCGTPPFFSSWQESVDGWCESMGIWTSKKNLRVSSLSEVADLSPKKRSERRLFPPRMVPYLAVEINWCFTRGPGGAMIKRAKSTTLNWVVATQRFFIFTPTWGRFPIWLNFSNGLKPPTS